MAVIFLAIAFLVILFGGFLSLAVLSASVGLGGGIEILFCALIVLVIVGIGCRRMMS
jgi:hypothetical protein